MNAKISTGSANVIADAATSPQSTVVPPISPAIAGGAVRAIMECAGITDILTKSLGSTNPHNLVRAAMNGLQQLTTVEQVARERGVEPTSIGYRSRAKVKETV